MWKFMLLLKLLAASFSYMSSYPSVAVCLLAGLLLKLSIERRMRNYRDMTIIASRPTCVALVTINYEHGSITPSTACKNNNTLNPSNTAPQLAVDLLK